MNEYHLIASNCHFAWRLADTGSVAQASVVKVKVPVSDCATEGKQIPVKLVKPIFTLGHCDAPGSVFLEQAVDFTPQPDDTVAITAVRDDAGHCHFEVETSDRQSKPVLAVQVDKVQMAKHVRLTNLLEFGEGHFSSADSTWPHQVASIRAAADPVVHVAYKVTAAMSGGIVQYQLPMDAAPCFMTAGLHAASIRNLATCQIKIAADAKSLSGLFKTIAEEVREKAAAVEAWGASQFRRLGLWLAMEKLKLFANKMVSDFQAEIFKPFPEIHSKASALTPLIKLLETILKSLQQLPPAETSTEIEGKKLAEFCLTKEVAGMAGDASLDLLDEVYGDLEFALSATPSEASIKQRMALKKFEADDVYYPLKAWGSRRIESLRLTPFYFLQKEAFFKGFANLLLRLSIKAKAGQLTSLSPNKIDGRFGRSVEAKNRVAVGGFKFDWSMEGLRISKAGLEPVMLANDKQGSASAMRLLFVDPEGRARLTFKGNLAAGGNDVCQVAVRESAGKIEAEVKSLTNAGYPFAESLAFGNHKHAVAFLQLYPDRGFSNVSVFKWSAADGHAFVDKPAIETLNLNDVDGVKMTGSPKLHTRPDGILTNCGMVFGDWLLFAYFFSDGPMIVAAVNLETRQTITHRTAVLDTAGVSVCPLESRSTKSAGLCLIRPAAKTGIYDLTIVSFDGCSFTSRSESLKLKASNAFWTSHKTWLVSYSVDRTLEAGRHFVVGIRKYAVRF